MVDEIEEVSCIHEFLEWKREEVRIPQVDLDGRSPNVYYTNATRWSRVCKKCNYIEITYDNPEDVKILRKEK